LPERRVGNELGCDRRRGGEEGKPLGREKKRAEKDRSEEGARQGSCEGLEKWIRKDLRLLS